MTTSHLSRAARRNAKRAQRKYRRIDNGVDDARINRLTFLGWGHLNVELVERLRRLGGDQ